MNDQVPPPSDPSQSNATPTQQASAIVTDLLAQDHQKFFVVTIVDGVLNIARAIITGSLVEKSNRLLALLGLWGLLAFAVLCLLWGLIATIMDASAAPLLAGIVVAIVTVLLSYVAGKFCNAGDAIIKSSPSEMSCRAFLDCLALLLIIFAVLALLTAVASVIAGFILPPMFAVATGHFALAAGYAYVAGLALNPEVVNHQVRPGASAGQEFIGILSFLLKAILRIVPILFGVLIITGTLLFALGIIVYLASSADERPQVSLSLLAHSGVIMFAATLPLVVYLSVIMYYLLVDLACAILRVGESAAHKG